MTNTLFRMSIKNRILLFIDYKSLSVADFEKICRLANGFVSNTTDGIRPSSISKISNAFPELNIQWLKTGDGEMINSNKINNVIHGNGFNISGNDNKTRDISIENDQNNSDLRRENEELKKEINRLKDELIKSKEQIIELMSKSNK